MKLRRLLLGYLIICGLAQAASCKQEFSKGLNDLYPFKFLVINPTTHIIIRSAGHTLEFIFIPDYKPFLFVDGQPAPLVGYIDPSAIQNQIAALCGPGFLTNPPGILGAMSKAASASPLASTAQKLVAGQTSEDIAVADFNGDGVPDSAALTGRGVYVTLRNADGTTLAGNAYPVTGAGVAQNIVTADFNGDGLPDLAITQGTSSTSANPFPPGSVTILLGKADGTFGPPVSSPAGSVGNSYLASGDFNGDGVTDLALTHTVSQGSGQVAVLLGKGDGTFGQVVDYPVGPNPFTLVAADFTGDGKLDLAELDAFGQANKVWVLPGRGDGTFQPAVSSASLTKEGFLAYADLNRDGKLDLVIADQPASAVEVMMGNGDGSFQAGKEYLMSAHPTSIAVLPLQDGNTSLFTADNAGGNFFLFFVTSDGVVHSPELRTVGIGPSAVAAVDLNGDRQPDLVISDPSAGQLYVKLSTGNGTFAGPVSYSAGIQPNALALADLNGDGKPDVIAADINGLDVLLGKGDGTLNTVNTFSATGQLTSVSVADFNADGKQDVAAASSQAGGIVLFPGNGNGTFQSARTIALPNALGTVSADFNGDGKPDLIVSSGPVDFQTPGSLAVLLGNGDGTFQSPRTIALPGPLFSTALAVGDLNGDGKPDVVAAVFGGARTTLAVLLGNGDGTFQPPILIASNTAPPAIAITDLDGDGKPDLLLGDCCGLAEAAFLLGNGDGTFQSESQFPSGPNPQGIAVADFNGDGKPDLAIIGQVMEASPRRGTLAILLNAFGPSGTGTANTASIVSAANPTSSAIAPGSLASAYGTDLAQGTPGLTSLPLPTTFGGTSISLTDSTGKQWQAPLLYVSAAQVNFLLPLGVAAGPAQLTITSGDGTQSSSTEQIALVAPGLFTLNSANLVAATVIRISADGTQQTQPVYSLTGAGAVVANPIDLGASSDRVYLVLFGTGLQAAGTAGVKVTAGTTDAPVQFVGPQGSFVGLDQVNVLLPHSLAGSGDIALQLTAAGLPANPVRLTIH